VEVVVKQIMFPVQEIAGYILMVKNWADMQLLLLLLEGTGKFYSTVVCYKLYYTYSRISLS